MSLLQQDQTRYTSHGKMPRVQRLLRKAQDSSGLLKNLYRLLYYFAAQKAHIEISSHCEIGGGLYMGHPYCITVNAAAKIGQNCNIHKGVTIGQENRGLRKGAPVIGNCVWIGINSTIVGSITIGDDVLIAPNSFVNCDIPAHSVVFGNPCIIKPRENATEGYINRKV